MSHHVEHTARRWDGEVITIHRLHARGGPMEQGGEEWDGSCSACDWKARSVGMDAWGRISHEFLHHHGIDSTGVTIYREAPHMHVEIADKRLWLAYAAVLILVGIGFGLVLDSVL